MTGWIPATATRSGGQQWPATMAEYDQFMCAQKGNKNAFGPWGDKDHPEGEPDKDARYKWAIPDMWSSIDEAKEWARKDPSLSPSLMFVLQRESDPYQAPADPILLIDGDDVVDADGNVHPGFREVVSELTTGEGYAALSSSDHGIHVPVKGHLPEGVKQINVPLSPDVDGFSASHIDQDDGDGLHIDIFDGKHLWKATGKHITGTPEECADADLDAVEEYADEYDSVLSTSGGSGGEVEDIDPDDIPEYTGPLEFEIDDGETLEYRAAVEAHYQGYAHPNFWRITGAVAAWGNALGKSKEEILTDLRGESREGSSAGYGGKTEERVRYDWDRAENGGFAPPGRPTLAIWGVLPPRYAKSDESSHHSWEYVRYLYEEYNAKTGRQAVEELLRDKYDFMAVEQTDTLYLYDKETGVYTERLGEVKGELKDGLVSHWSTTELHEILARLKQESLVQPRDFNGKGEFNAPHVCVKNGVLNLFTRELKPHSPDYYFVDRVPVTYDARTDTSRYEEFLEQITGREADWKAMMEMVGHALVTDAHERGWKKFLILYGGADNGKSFFYERVSDLLNGLDGEEKNTMSVKLEKMASNRFSKNAMYGSMANIAGEIDGKKIRNTADIKDITGGDNMEIEPKGGDSFSDTMNTTLMFAANDPPIIGERDKEAIATRIVPVELPKTFTDDPDPNNPMEEKKVPARELEEDLATPEAMGAFLELALDGIERMASNNGDVSLPETRWERLRRYESNADPMKEFDRVCLEPSTDDYLVKFDVTRIYEEFADANGYETGSNTHRALHGALDYSSSHPRDPNYSDTTLPLRPWDERKHTIDRVTLTEKGLKYAADAGIVVDDADDGAEESDAPVAIASLEPGDWYDVEATVAVVSEGSFGDVASGQLDGPHGTTVTFRIPGGNEHVLEGLQGKKVRIENAKLGTDEDGFLQFEINDGVTVKKPWEDDWDAATEGETATDGGGSVPADASGAPAARKRVVGALANMETPATQAAVTGRVTDAHDDVTPDDVQRGLERALESGDVYEPTTEKYDVNR